MKAISPWLNHPSVSFFVGLILLRFRECGWVGPVNKKCLLWGPLVGEKIPTSIRFVLPKIWLNFRIVRIATLRFSPKNSNHAQNPGTLKVNFENSEYKLSGKYTLSGHPHSSWRRKKSKKIRLRNAYIWSKKHQVVFRLFQAYLWINHADTCLQYIKMLRKMKEMIVMNIWYCLNR